MSPMRYYVRSLDDHCQYLSKKTYLALSLQISCTLPVNPLLAESKASRSNSGLLFPETHAHFNCPKLFASGTKRQSRASVPQPRYHRIDRNPSRATTQRFVASRYLYAVAISNGP